MDEDKLSLNDLRKLLNESSKEIFKLKQIISSLPGHVYWKNLDGVYEGANNEFLEALSARGVNNLTGIRDKDLLGSKEARKVVANDNKIISKKKKLSFEEKVIDRKGNEEIYFSQKIPLNDFNGKIIGIAGISINITARKKAEESLKKANDKLDKNNQAKAKFLKVLQHDLRNKLTGILSFSDLLLDDLNDKKQLKKGLSIINYAAKEILPTLDRINHYLSLETGQLKVHSCIFDLTATLKDFEEEYWEELSKKGLKIECILDPNLGSRFEGDYALICDVLEHLIKNAIKYTDQGGITLETRLLRKRKNYVWIDIVVSDTGRGISKEAESGLFDLFEYDKNDRQYTNPGINLSISKKIAKLLEGDLLVDSFEGKGTTLTFHIKLKIEEPIKSLPTPKGRLSYEEVSRMSLEPFQPQFNKDKFLVLVVEDDPINQESLKTLLFSYFHCDILLAPDLKIARKKIVENKNNIDLILTDIQLPDGEGQEIIPYLHTIYSSQENFPWIIAVTAFSRDIDVKHFIEKGMVDVISKPITLRNLSEVIISLFGDKTLKKRIRNK